MSLRWFHVLFITTALVLSVVVAAWAVRHGQWILALLALAGGSGLLVYRGTFLRKAQDVGLE